MRIDRVPPAIATGLINTALGPGERREANAFDTEDPRPTSLGAAAMTAPTTSVEMLVALASVDPAVERRRKLAAEADRGLGLLERLYQDLQGDGVLPARLDELSAWVERFAVPDDPELAEVARDIEVRVRVELAKHDLKA
jgi:hypothetical protein